VSSALATPVNQIAAGVLDVGYADIGPVDPVTAQAGADGAVARNPGRRTSGMSSLR